MLYLNFILTKITHPHHGRNQNKRRFPKQEKISLVPLLVSLHQLHEQCLICYFPRWKVTSQIILTRILVFLSDTKTLWWKLHTEKNYTTYCSVSSAAAAPPSLSLNIFTPIYLHQIENSNNPHELKLNI